MCLKIKEIKRHLKNLSHFHKSFRACFYNSSENFPDNSEKQQYKAAESGKQHFKEPTSRKFNFLGI